MATLAIPINSTAAAEYNDSETISHAFLAALLLTASSSRAEAAVLESIRLLDEGETPRDEILRRTFEIALRDQAGVSDTRPATIDEAGSMLPKELRRVLRLAPIDRRSFVLRYLAAAQCESSTRLSHLQIHQLDERAVISAQDLARLVQKENAE